MKKLRTSKRMMALAIVPASISVAVLIFALWLITQFNIAVMALVGVALIAAIVLAVVAVADKGISFNEEKFVVKGDREYSYDEIEAVIVKNSEIHYRRYKAIIVGGEEVCIFDDLYQNAKEFRAILEKHGFTFKSDNRMMD